VIESFLVTDDDSFRQDVVKSRPCAAIGGGVCVSPGCPVANAVNICESLGCFPNTAVLVRARWSRSVPWGSGFVEIATDYDGVVTGGGCAYCSVDGVS